MLRTILPNCIAPLFVQTTLGVGDAILSSAALSFLGLGAQPPVPEWGLMIASAKEFVTSAWWIVTFPGIAILLTVLGFNLVGDTLRDALDPRLKD
jgi:ABC-type dipeptide/oligopeptide/nickel transport system permease subunit